MLIMFLTLTITGQLLFFETKTALGSTKAPSTVQLHESSGCPHQRNNEY